MEQLQPQISFDRIKTFSHWSGSIIGNLVPSLPCRILYNLEHTWDIICTSSLKPIFYLEHFFLLENSLLC